MELNISDIIFAAINFTIMALVLAKLLHKPMIRLLDGRKAAIEAQTLEAQTLMEQANALVHQGKEDRILAQQEAARSLQEASAQAEQRKQHLLEEARAQSDRMLKETRERLELEKQNATVELKNGAVTLAAQLAQKIVKTQVPVSSPNRIEEIAFELSRPEVVEQLHSKVAQLKADAVVELVTSQPISTIERELIENVLAQAGVEQTMLISSNDDLSGGSILTVGDLVFDGSVTDKLSRIVANMFANVGVSSRMEGEEYELSH